MSFIPNIPKDVYRFSPDEVSEGEKEWSATLIGALIGSSISFNSMMEFMTENWPIDLPKLYIKENGVMVLKFKNIEDRSWVLNRGPWTIGGNKTLIIKEWSTGMKIDWSSFESIPVWVKILDIDPIFLSSSHMLNVIGNMIGKPIIKDHITNVEKLSYARMLVEVTIEETKRSEVVLESYDGTVYKHKVEFEWLPWACDNCNIFGHSTYYCNKLRAAYKEPNPEAPHIKTGRTWKPRGPITKPAPSMSWAQVVSEPGSSNGTRGLDLKEGNIKAITDKGRPAVKQAPTYVRKKALEESVRQAEQPNDNHNAKDDSSKPLLRRHDEELGIDRPS